MELHDDEQTIFCSSTNNNTSNRHQVYVIINNTSEEFDGDNNPIINPQNLQQGANHMVEGEIKATAVARVKVHLTAPEWETIKATVNHGVVILPNSTREVLMGYQYALHQQRKHLLQ
jgi:hypothetical protein